MRKEYYNHDRFSERQIKFYNTKRAEYFTHTVGGRVKMAYKHIQKFAKTWGYPICTESEFMEWSLKDPTFLKLYDAWKVTKFAYHSLPVCNRIVKANGFVLDNLRWELM